MHDKEGIENRRAARAAEFWSVCVTDEEKQTNTARVINASVRGILMLSARPYKLGEEVDLELVLSQGTSVRSLARIVREHPAPSGLSAYGVEFEYFHDNGYARLRDALAGVHADEPLRAPLAAYDETVRT